MEKQKKSFEDWLREKGFLVDRDFKPPKLDSYKYKKTAHSPEKMLGMILHSLLSRRPRPNFYTDNHNLYYSSSENRDYELDPSKKEEDIARESEIARILGIDCTNPKIFGTMNGHLVLEDFSGIFKDNPKHIDGKSLNYDSSYYIVVRDEKENIKKNVKRNEETLQELIEILYSEGGILSTYARKLESNLENYGYTPKSLIEKK